MTHTPAWLLPLALPWPPRFLDWLGYAGPGERLMVWWAGDELRHCDGVHGGNGLRPGVFRQYAGHPRIRRTLTMCRYQGWAEPPEAALLLDGRRRRVATGPFVRLRNWLVMEAWQEGRHTVPDAAWVPEGAGVWVEPISEPAAMRSLAAWLAELGGAAERAS